MNQTKQNERPDRVKRSPAKVGPLDRSVIAFILAIKALILIFGAEAFQILQNARPAGLHGWLEIWSRWDAQHYLNLAEHGYQAAGEDRFLLVFYPLFPWLTRLFEFFTRDYLSSAFIVSGLASIAAGLLLLRLVQMDFSSKIARSSVWFLFIFPTSYFLHIGYTESLFLALAVGCFLAARKERWWLAGLLGALACLTRVNGLLLAPALTVEAFQQYRTSRRLQWGWLWIAVVPLGFGGYLLLNAHVAGDAFQFLAFQREHWFKSLAPPWAGIKGTLDAISRAPAEARMVGVQELFFVLLGLASTIWCGVKLRPAYTVWMAGNWLLFTSTSFVLSVPRYTLVLFPIFILFAQLAQKFVWRGVITVWSLLFLALFITQFVQGRWAF